jgi:asparagine synthase (glutamine-hydrolysing)
MCGIVGSVNVAHEVSLEAFAHQAERWLSKCDRLLFHRGPDSGGTLIEDRVALGARRLRIHDLSVTADQPFETTDGRIAIVFNGAIFNFRDLRDELKSQGHMFVTDCDTETIAIGYAAWGDRIFKRFDGMFAVAILDRSRKRLVLARDKLGIKPLYIVRNSGFWAFSSEIKPLLAHPGVPLEVNSDAVSEQLAFQFIMPPRTLFKDVEVFMPGHVASVDLVTGETETRPYWQITADLIENDDAPSFENAFESSLRRCWDADRPVGVQLSGGVDSSLVCLLSGERLDIFDYPTFSVLFDDSIAKYYLPRSEEVFIDRIAQQCGVENFSWTFDAKDVRPALAEAIWYHEQPLYGPSTALYMLLARQIKNYVTVLITGEGADDIFLGYFQDWDFTLSPEGLFKFFIGRPVLENLVGGNQIDQAISARWDLVNSNRLIGMSLRQKASVATIETVLHGLLARHDRMFMSNSIEGRPPFCTDDIIRARFGMDDALVHDGRHGKLELKNLLSGYTDRNFAFRKKIGFSAPFGDWCSSPSWWNGYVSNIDLELMAQFVNVDELRRHQLLPEGQEKWSSQNLNLIFSLAQLQLWYKIFFDSQDYTVTESWKQHVPVGVS